ncbi:MAG: polysaccharide deacetylase family protein [Thermoanaerobaculia bacterium]
MPPTRTLSLFLALCFAASLLHAADAPKRATILCYHIVESPSDTEFSMSREAFRTQMEYLASSGYNVISLTELFEYVSGQNRSIPDNAVVVTVDDGWRSTYTRIYPEMKKLGLPFTVFVYPKFVGMSDYALTWRQIREMADDGVDIQSHTYSHAYLTKRRHPSFGPKRYSEWLERELAGSRETIEEKTGKPVRFLAYPYGDYDAVVARRAMEAGYDAAVTANFGAVGRSSDLFRLSRVIIYARTSFAEFRRQVGAAPLQLISREPETPKLDAHHPVVSATIRDHDRLDPASVGMAILGAGQIPFSYDARTGRISLVVRESLGPKRRQVVVWARDRTSGRRVETAWTILPPAIGEDVIPVAARRIERTRGRGTDYVGGGSGSAPR